MAKTKTGTVVYWHQDSAVLATFRIMPEEGSAFPEYKAGQYIALRREDCLLTKKIVDPDGRTHYFTELDENGIPKRGPVTHSYSIASAPFVTRAKGYLEFYIILERHEDGSMGRLTESMFRLRPDGDNKLTYYDLITGTFTLDKRAAGYQNVVMVGTGTGVAPFVSMLKQLDHEAQNDPNPVRYTLFHTNRTRGELDYYNELMTIAGAGRLDFVYVPTVSRVSEGDRNDPTIGKGRANNVLRAALGMRLKEEQDLELAFTSGDVPLAQAALDRTTLPVMPLASPRELLLARMDPPQTVIMTCGNPNLMADIRVIAETNGIRFEKEDW